MTPSTKRSDDKQQIRKEEAKAASDVDEGGMTDEEEESGMCSMCFDFSHLLTPELLLRSHSAHIPKEHNEDSDGSNIVQNTELSMGTDSGDEGGLISNTEGEEQEDDDDNDGKEDKEEDEYCNEKQQATSLPTEQLNLKTKVGR